ncbi:hypothetical protein [Streptomyces sp. NPDC056468]|uniref:hypothetical protein n=1 Tax=Streptomyces sp. NPDC056468 TaxID=3345830 RepID=UPI0036AE9CB1
MRVPLLSRHTAREMGPEFYDPKGYRTDLNVWSREHFDDLWSLAQSRTGRSERLPEGAAASAARRLTA